MHADEFRGKLVVSEVHMQSEEMYGSPRTEILFRVQGGLTKDLTDYLMSPGNVTLGWHNPTAAVHMMSIAGRKRKTYRPLWVPRQHAAFSITSLESYGERIVRRPIVAVQKDIGQLTIDTIDAVCVWDTRAEQGKPTYTARILMHATTPHYGMLRLSLHHGAELLHVAPFLGEKSLKVEEGYILKDGKRIGEPQQLA